VRNLDGFETDVSLQSGISDIYPFETPLVK